MYTNGSKRKSDKHNQPRFIKDDVWIVSWSPPEYDQHSGGIELNKINNHWVSGNTSAMKNLIKVVLGKIRLSVIIILSILIGVSWTISYQKFSELQHEADKVWTEHIERINGEVSVKATSLVTPEEERGEIKPSSPPSWGLNH